MIWPAFARAFSCPLADLIDRSPDPIAPAVPQRQGLSKIVKQGGPRPLHPGQTYRARDPRTDIDVRFHRPAGPRRAENLSAADPFCPQFSPSWPQFVPAADSYRSAIRGRSAGENAPGPPDIGSENHDFKRKNAIRATRPPAHRSGG